MAGKSTYIRTAALLTLLAQTGSFVPAESARIGVVDAVFTRIGADDALHRGQSTFMVEMTETANILHNATSRSLVVLDEIGRGTSTLDGLSLAWAIAESLAGGLGEADASATPRTLFATHYHELTDLEERLPGRVANLRVLVEEIGDEIVFLHRVGPGRADQSYGVQVARLAGLPQIVVDRARDLLRTLSVSHTAADAAARPAPPTNDPQMALFAPATEPHPIVEAIREADLNALTPLAAFDLLREWKSDVESSSNPSSARRTKDD
jgi:DNA mismatch repair protein MutS